MPNQNVGFKVPMSSVKRNISSTKRLLNISVKTLKEGLYNLALAPHYLMKRGNSCECAFFSPESHEWLLSDAVDILPHLLLPLAGPEEFSEDDMDKLPPDLQYLDENKQRETDPDIRKMLLDSLLQVGGSNTDHHVISSCNFIRSVLSISTGGQRKASATSLRKSATFSP